VLLVQQGINCRKDVADTVNTCQGSCDAATNDVSTVVFRYMPAAAANCASVAGASANDPVVQKPRNETIINVGSNKTLLGTGSAAAIWGATLNIKGSSNVIIQNLALGEINPVLLGAGAAITIDAAHHVWVDHCRFWNVSDGFVDALNGSQAVTVSWNLFQGRNAAACGGQHNSASTADGAWVTYHHNFFDATLGCSPRLVAGAHAHLFNNCWSSVLAYSVQVATLAQALIEANEFDDSRKPYYGADNCLVAASPCGIRVPDATPNLFFGVSQTETHETGGTVDPLTYDASTYTVADAAAAKTQVIVQAGTTLSP
jgi:pectate lyase